MNQNSFIPRIIGRQWWRLSYRAQFGLFHIDWHFQWNQTYGGYDRTFNLLTVGVGPRGVWLAVGEVGSTN